MRLGGDQMTADLDDADAGDFFRNVHEPHVTLCLMTR
jgi:hypothetical protein